MSRNHATDTGVSRTQELSRQLEAEPLGSGSEAIVAAINNQRENMQSILYGFAAIVIFDRIWASTAAILESLVRAALSREPGSRANLVCCTRY